MTNRAPLLYSAGLASVILAASAALNPVAANITRVISGCMSQQGVPCTCSESFGTGTSTNVSEGVCSIGKIYNATGVVPQLTPQQLAAAGTTQAGAITSCDWVQTDLPSYLTAAHTGISWVTKAQCDAWTASCNAGALSPYTGC